MSHSVRSRLHKARLEGYITREELKRIVVLPDNATNGEVLCMLFPNMHYTLSDISPRVVTTIGVGSSFDKDWWNAPYKKNEGKE